MRMSSPSLSPAIKERKTSQSASSKIDSIIKQLFLPMLNMPTPERTSFLPEDSEDQLLRQVAQEKPEALTSETEFVDYMVLLYHKFQQLSDLGKEGLGLVQPGMGEPPLCVQLPIQIPQDISHLPEALPHGLNPSLGVSEFENLSA